MHSDRDSLEHVVRFDMVSRAMHVDRLKSVYAKEIGRLQKIWADQLGVVQLQCRVVKILRVCHDWRIRNNCSGHFVGWIENERKFQNHMKADEYQVVTTNDWRLCFNTIAFGLSKEGEPSRKAK